MVVQRLFALTTIKTKKVLSMHKSKIMSTLVSALAVSIFGVVLFSTPTHAEGIGGGLKGVIMPSGGADPIDADRGNGQTVYAYTKDSTESIEYSFGPFTYPLAGGGSFDMTKIRCDATDSTGAKIWEYEGAMHPSATTISGTLTNITPGITTIKCYGITGPQIEGFTAIFEWDIQVQDDSGAEMKGRIWTKLLSLANNWWTEPWRVLDISNLYSVSDTGYIYKLNLLGYNGGVSDIEMNAAGSVTDTTTNTPIDKSVDLRSTTNREVGAYRIFFSSPAADLPEEAPSAGGTMKVLPELMDDKDIQIDTSDILGAEGYGGDFIVSLPEAYVGEFNLNIDTNNNGRFDDPEDLSLTARANGGAENSNLRLSWDGKDGVGKPVASQLKVNVDVTSDVSSRWYLVLFDVELLRGGIEVTKVNGPQAGDTTAYFNDLGIDQSKGIDNNGNFCPLYGSAPATKDGRMGVASAGGIHSWGSGASSGIFECTYGDNRSIQFWTHNGNGLSSEVFHIAPPLPPATGSAQAQDEGAVLSAPTVAITLAVILGVGLIAFRRSRHPSRHLHIQ